MPAPPDAEPAAAPPLALPPLALPPLALPPLPEPPPPVVAEVPLLDDPALLEPPGVDWPPVLGVPAETPLPPDPDEGVPPVPPGSSPPPAEEHATPPAAMLNRPRTNVGNRSGFVFMGLPAARRSVSPLKAAQENARGNDSAFLHPERTEGSAAPATDARARQSPSRVMIQVRPDESFGASLQARPYERATRARSDAPRCLRPQSQAKSPSTTPVPPAAGPPGAAPCMLHPLLDRSCVTEPS
jgi:hypothetical protein